MIEADGGVYPCDFYVNDEWRLGSVSEKSFAELEKTETCKRFVSVSEHVSPECAACRWLPICRGGCRRSREPFENGLPVLNTYCPSYKAFFEYAAGRLDGLAAALAARRRGR